MEPTPVRLIAKSEAIVCTLGESEREDRVAEWRDLLSAATSSADRGELRVLSFVPGAEMAARVADLAAREQGCCSFFDFRVHITGAAVELEIGAPEEARSLIDELFGAPR